MTIEKKALLIVLLCSIVVFAIGCIPAGPQPEIHPTAGASVMFIPEGCKIGKITAPENGIFIGESKLIEQMLRQREEEEREERERERKRT